jgi:SpoVK/Ycf46/Vps4 family AAA+-type ATPase
VSASVRVPERFSRRIVGHALTVHVVPGYAMIMTIQGPPGDGKSFQTHHSLRDAGFVVTSSSSSLLSGSFEGEPIEMFKKLYREASQSQASGAPAAIIVEDFDLSPANERADTKYTVNTQLLSGFLMNLADDPALCDVGTSARIPIFLTANALTDLYAPLTRPGRMEFFSWVPDESERAEMFLSALEARVVNVTADDARRLAKRYPKATVAAVAAAANDCAAAVCYELASRADGRASVADLRTQLQGGLHIDISAIEIAMKARLNGDGPRRYIP